MRKINNSLFFFPILFLLSQKLEAEPLVSNPSGTYLLDPQGNVDNNCVQGTYHVRYTITDQFGCNYFKNFEIYILPCE